MVSMGFLEPSTGRAALWRADSSAIQFTGVRELLGGVCVHPTCPHEFTVQESLWKACPRTFFFHHPFPVRRGGVDTQTTILRLVAIDSTATAEREREGGLLLPWREIDCERGCRMQQRWLRARCRERERERERE
jgi:hypothetical protein